MFVFLHWMDLCCHWMYKFFEPIEFKCCYFDRIYSIASLCGTVNLRKRKLIRWNSFIISCSDSVYFLWLNWSSHALKLTAHWRWMFDLLDRSIHFIYSSWRHLTHFASLWWQNFNPHILTFRFHFMFAFAAFCLTILIVIDFSGWDNLIHQFIGL